MSLIKKLIFVAVIVAAWMCFKCCKGPSLPTIDPNPWWGPGKPTAEDPSVKQFKINIPDKDIDDLSRRLSLPLLLTPSMENTNFTYGMDSSTLERIIHYWANEYKWRSRERILNSFDHFKTRIEGLNIHFMRVKPVKTPPSVKVVPLLLIHGWPGSIVEFIDILPFLTTPQEGSNVVFEVICPSIPGYGFSQAASKPGLGQIQTAQIFLKLMKRIGYEKFYVQGGDWGAIVASMMATMYPENILGMHINMFALMSPGRTMRYILGAYLPSGFLFPKEFDSLFYPMGKMFSLLMRETGYMHIQATKPDTVGAALSNTPVGLAAYILEKFSGWTHTENIGKSDGGLLSSDFPISLDKLLDNVSLYWFTRSITSSMRYYAELPTTLGLHMDEIQTNVPAAFTLFKEDFAPDPKEFAALKYTDIIYHRVEEGGHFPAMERPKLLAGEVHEFVTIVEERQKNEGRSEL